jgi:DNA-binding CsgD family transcriptional regulator
MLAQTIPLHQDSELASMARARADRKLTPREIEVLQCAADGEECKSTAELLGIAVGTVKQLRYKAILKLGAETIAHAVAQSLRRGLIA